jgi:hypothetical protein
LLELLADCLSLLVPSARAGVAAAIHQIVIVVWQPLERRENIDYPIEFARFFSSASNTRIGA